MNDLKRAVILAPSDPGARYALAEALFGNGDFKAAAAQLEKALELDPGFANARRLLVRAWARDGREAAARQLLEKAVHAHPEDASLRDELAELLEAEGRIDDALLAIEEAARLEPKDARRRVTIARLLTAVRLPKRALEALGEARALCPGDQQISAEIVKVEAELGAPESASVLEQPLLARIGQLQGSPVVEAAVAAAGLQAASAALVKGDSSAAKRALVLAPPSSRASGAFLLLNAELRLLDGDESSAERSFLAATRACPPLREAALRLGDLAAAHGDLASARARYSEAAAGANEGLAAERLAALDARERAKADERPAIGRIGALGWHPLGGCVSPLEAMAVPGPGLLRFSGNVGPAGREAADVAFTCLKARADELGIAEKVRGFDLHLHFSDTEIGKDGMSSGLALVLAGISAYTQRPLGARLAATGEITLGGEVKKVGGIHEKMVAACIAGIRTVLYPRRNGAEVAELPPEVAARMRLVPVDSVSEALAKACG